MGSDRADAELQHAPGRVGGRARVKPLSAETFAVHFTLSRGTHDKLCYAQELLGHALPCGDLAQVLDRALDALIARLEQQKFAATARPRPGRGQSATNRRHVPARVKRAVWARDQGQCTFLSEPGRRCPARKCLEFDHLEEVARGGEASVAGIRLRCRAHNQYGAECTLGSEFMRQKRLAAAEARAVAKQRRAAARAGAPREDQERDVVPWLRRLGFSAAEAHRAATRCEEIPAASLEQRVRVALSCFGNRSARVGLAGEGLERTPSPTVAVPSRDGP